MNNNRMANRERQFPGGDGERHAVLSECGSKAPAFSENDENHEKRRSLPKELEQLDRGCISRKRKKRELSLAYKSES